MKNRKPSAKSKEPRAVIQELRKRVRQERKSGGKSKSEADKRGKGWIRIRGFKF